MNNSIYRTTTDPHEAPMQASKWLKCPMLISADEMADLLQKLSPFYFFITGSLVKPNQAQIPLESFLNCYRDYVSALMHGELPNEAACRSFFSSVMTVTSDAVYALQVEGGNQLIRLNKPVIQLQNHRLNYSEADQTFRSMTFGSEGIFWGIQFSYPQLYQDSKTKEIMPVELSDLFPNTQLFRTLQRWSRDHTIPAPFLIGGKKINVPVRLGKECLSWINAHPQLVQKGFQIQG